MEKWFSLPSYIAPIYNNPPDTNTITMDWVLKFARAKNIYGEIMRDKIWANDAAKFELAKRLNKAGLLTSVRKSRVDPKIPCGGLLCTKPFDSFDKTFAQTQKPLRRYFSIKKTFGDLSKPVPKFEEEYINSRQVKAETVLDDMTAALGDFQFRVVVAGSVSYIPEQDSILPVAEYLVTISEIGIYIVDSYDFNNRFLNEYLGYWCYNKETDYYSVDLVPKFSSPHLPYITINNCAEVYNSSFQKWRSENGRGGDFLVFSDLYKPKFKPVCFPLYIYSYGSGLYCFNKGELKQI